MEETMTLEQMGINEWLIIGAALAGPILAVQAQKWVERLRTDANRRAWIFETLMATRGARMAPDHVRALNAIDLAFYGRRNLGVVMRGRDAQEVIDTWRNYHAHLSKPVPTSPDGNANWGATSEELFVNLLAALAKANHYRFDRAQLQTGGYTPMGYSNIEAEQQALRLGLIQTLAGGRSVPVEIRRSPRSPSSTPASAPAAVRPAAVIVPTVQPASQ
jgi:hypothetical protein